MFKQAFRFAFVALIWKQYKATIVSTLLLFAYLFLISNLHNDYLNHLELQQQSTSSGLSFIYKWIAYLVGISIYFLFHWWRSKTANDKKSKKKFYNKKNTEQNVIKKDIDADDDPFAKIRERKELRSRADFLEGKD